MAEHYQCRGGGDAAAYALGALDDRELDGFRRHLETCSVCEAEVKSFARLIDVLPMSAPQYPASRALRRRVMADVRTDARRQRAAREFSPSRPVVGLGTGGLLGGRRLSRLAGSPRRAGLAGGAVALALVLVAILIGTGASGPAKPATRVVSASVGSGQVVINGQHGELIVHRLAQVSAAQTYEVWEKRADGSVQPTSALFNTSATGASAINVPGSLRGVREILVTKEKSGGAAVPSGKPVVVARLS